MLVPLFSYPLESDEINVVYMQKDSKFHPHCMTHSLMKHFGDSHPSILQLFLTYVISNFSTIILNTGLKGRHRWKYAFYFETSK